MELASGRTICAIGAATLAPSVRPPELVSQRMICAICAVDLANEESCAIDAVKLGRRKKILAICAAEFVSGKLICAICAVSLGLEA